MFCSHKESKNSETLGLERNMQNLAETQLTVHEIIRISMFCLYAYKTINYCKQSLLNCFAANFASIYISEIHPCF